MKMLSLCNLATKQCSLYFICVLSLCNFWLTFAIIFLSDRPNVFLRVEFLLCVSDRLKDGKVAAEQCSRYHMDGNSLVIRDVAEEDAGTYVVLVRIQEHGLFQNLTLTLEVNGEKR